MAMYPGQFAYEPIDVDFQKYGRIVCSTDN